MLLTTTSTNGAALVGTALFRLFSGALGNASAADDVSRAVLVHKDPHHWTHGEEGLSPDYHQLPSAFVGVFNTKYLYWLALAYVGGMMLLASLGLVPTGKMRPSTPMSPTCTLLGMPPSAMTAPFSNSMIVIASSSP